MQQKAGNELGSRQAEHALPALGIRPHPERYLVIGDADDALIGNRHPMRVTPEIVEHGLWPAQRLLGIDHPVVGVKALRETMPSRRVEEVGQMPLPAQVIETGDELAAKHF